MLTKLFVVIISKYICISNCCGVHLKLVYVICQLYLSKTVENNLINER